MLVDVSAVLMRGRLIALSKPDGGVRAIATGTTLRRLVGRTLAKQFAKAFEAECKVDGIGACDHVSRAAMLQRLVNMEEGRAILPFVRLSCGSPSRNQWFNEDEECRTVTQVEGGARRSLDASAPGIQGALEEGSTQLLAGEQMCAFLDDVHVVCQPGAFAPHTRSSPMHWDESLAFSCTKARLGCEQIPDTARQHQ